MVEIKGFEKPRVPNFVRTDIGVIDLGNLTPKEINRYISFWKSYLLANWVSRKGNSSKHSKPKAEESRRK